jgi:hypothetical protein
MLVRLSALTLFELRVLLVNDVQTPFAADDLAIRRAWFEGGPDLHDFLGIVR